MPLFPPSHTPRRWHFRQWWCDFDTPQRLPLATGSYRSLPLVDRIIGTMPGFALPSPTALLRGPYIHRRFAFYTCGGGSSTSHLSRSDRRAASLISGRPHCPLHLSRCNSRAPRCPPPRIARPPRAREHLGGPTGRSTVPLDLFFHSALAGPGISRLYVRLGAVIMHRSELAAPALSLRSLWPPLTCTLL